MSAEAPDKIASDVSEWLDIVGCSQLKDVFAENLVDFQVLRSLTMDDLKEMGISQLGLRKKVIIAVEQNTALPPK